MPTNAETFFAEVVGGPDPWAYVTSIPARIEPVCETEWLDFKREPSSHRDTLSTWSEAVSGFGNTEGGVLVWGLDCRKEKLADGSEVDAARDHCPVERPAALAAKLRENINNASDPPIQGIRIEAFEGPEGGGYVVCLIPEGNQKPYRAEQKTNKPYIIRSGASFLVMNRAVLRTMFFPVSIPLPQITVTPKWEVANWDASTPQAMEIELHSMIQNVGSVSAESLYVEAAGTHRGKWETSTYQWKPRPETFDGSFGVEFAPLLHPRMRTEMLFYTAKIPADVAIGSHEMTPAESVILRFDVFAKDMTAQYLEVSFTADELRFRQPKIAEPRNPASRK